MIISTKTENESDLCSVLCCYLLIIIGNITAMNGHVNNTCVCTAECLSV